MSDFVPECGGQDPHCACVIRWQDGKRFVKYCGQHAPFEEFVYQQFATINAKLDRLSGSTISHLVP